MLQNYFKITTFLQVNLQPSFAVSNYCMYIFPTIIQF